MGCFTKLIYLLFVILVTAVMVAVGTTIHSFIEDGMQPRASLELTAGEAEIALWIGLAFTWLISLSLGAALVRER